MSNVIIVGIQLAGEPKEQLDEDLDELEALLATLGLHVKARMIQRRQRLTANCLIGTGKVDEIRDLARQEGARLIAFDRPLSGPQVRNLEKMTGCLVMDRAGVILDIFAKHARTNQAKTQVEIAKLEYMLPRLTNAWTHFHRQTGGRGIASRGMGEKQLEIDRRRARERITRLNKQLEQFARERQTQRKARTNELKVAIVGYTNSGKTTLMNGLTNAGLLAKDELFATLDTNIKTIDPSTRPRILLSDTVGFIRNLPHSLVESFKSTLDEVKEADLLLHVVDVSHHAYDEHIKVTDTVLEEIGAGDVPTLMIFNKVDQLQDRFLPKILRQAYPGSLAISAMNGADLRTLREKVFQYFAAHMARATVMIPHSEQEIMSLIYKSCLIINADYSDEKHVVFDLQAHKPVLSRLQPYMAEHAS